MSEGLGGRVREGGVGGREEVGERWEVGDDVGGWKGWGRGRREGRRGRLRVGRMGWRRRRWEWGWIAR
ncbi:hypothetical protein, partial [Brevibacterium casei]|uniref:hypothetical protein n=1 Tax=Brevibacterium casei TaxID=33889 RepID=UPI001C9306F0